MVAEPAARRPDGGPRRVVAPAAHRHRRRHASQPGRSWTATPRDRRPAPPTRASPCPSSSHRPRPSTGSELRPVTVAAGGGGGAATVHRFQRQLRRQRHDRRPRPRCRPPCASSPASVEMLNPPAAANCGTITDPGTLDQIGTRARERQGDVGVSRVGRGDASEGARRARGRRRIERHARSACGCGVSVVVAWTETPFQVAVMVTGVSVGHQARGHARRRPIRRRPARSPSPAAGPPDSSSTGSPRRRRRVPARAASRCRRSSRRRSGAPGRRVSALQRGRADGERLRRRLRPDRGRRS